MRLPVAEKTVLQRLRPQTTMSLGCLLKSVVVAAMMSRRSIYHASQGALLVTCPRKRCQSKLEFPDF
jgi:hypothetical protein